jgi:3-oxoacyl-[acyl-carrier-protein] synthase III
MTLANLYLSRPGTRLPVDCYDNDRIIELVKKNYRGSKLAWVAIEAAIIKILGKCNTKVRYLDFDPSSRVAGYAADAARDCIEKNNADLNDIDMVIFGGVAREYFEPATAMEVCTNLGIAETHAFDVTTACVGHLEAVQAACAYLTLHDDYQTALVVTAELTREFLSFDIQSLRDLQYKVAGLTIGNGAAAFLVSKRPFGNGSLKIVSTDTYSIPSHWDLCQVPIHGTFTSSSTELMKLHRHIIPRLKVLFEKLGWEPNDVSHYCFHQPSEFMTQKVLSKVGADLERGVYTHHLYGNNASATIGIVMNHLLSQKELSSGEKLMLGSAASGFTMATISGIWMNS